MLPLLQVKKTKQSQARAANEHSREADVGDARTSHEPDREPSALDEARAERVEAAGRLVRARRGQDPPERRSGGLPHANAAGALLGVEVRAAGGHLRRRQRRGAVGAGE